MGECDLRSKYEQIKLSASLETLSAGCTAPLSSSPFENDYIWLPEFLN